MKNIIFLFLSIFLIISCAKEAEYDLYIYNSKGENALAFEKMAEDYERQTGVKVKVFSIGSGQDHMETLRSEMNSRNKPSIFAIQGLKELVEWQEGGFVVDLATSTVQPQFTTLVDSIPENMRLTTDGKNSYGIPYNIEGFGFIIDEQMLVDLFVVDNADNILTDLKASSYNDFENFVISVDNYIKNPSASTVTLNGNQYTFRPNKTGLASNLTGVFAVMGAEKWTYGDHTMTVALNSVFDSPNASFNATDTDIENTKEPVKAFMELLDLKTKYLAGKDGPEKRGQALVSSINYGYDPTVQLFTDGKALFLKQGNWAYQNIENVNKDMAQRLHFVPVKMPFTDESIIVEGFTPQKMNNSIPVFVPNYYAINTMVSDEEKQEAEKFLLWLNNTDEGMNYIINEFNFIPYNADPASVNINNSLGNSILEYVAEGNTQNNSVMGTPATLTGTIVGGNIMEEYLTKENWNEQDYEDVANLLIDNWKNMKN